jgi:hypothetical protein
MSINGKSALSTISYKFVNPISYLTLGLKFVVYEVIVRKLFIFVRVSIRFQTAISTRLTLKL